MSIARYLRGVRAVAAEVVDIVRESLNPRLKRERVAHGVSVSRRDGKPLRTWTEREMRELLAKRPR